MFMLIAEKGGCAFVGDTGNKLDGKNETEMINTAEAPTMYRA
ncbi:hypothetical protein PV433_00795 [Paenibacillus sp. GYB004]